MSEQIFTIVRIPLSEIVEWMRTKHILPQVLADSRIEGDNLILYFNQEEATQIEDEASFSPPNVLTRKRRAHRKRNRMKTRGWTVVARITNSKGQKSAIYKPFVDALQDQSLTKEEQRKKVQEILRSNRNKPTEGSIRYFLENTLEYLKGGAKNGSH